MSLVSSSVGAVIPNALPEESSSTVTSEKVAAIGGRLEAPPPHADKVRAANAGQVIFFCESLVLRFLLGLEL